MWFEVFTFCVWGLLCVAVFAFQYYNHGYNSNLEDQWKCLSGVIVTNKPLMTFVMANLSASAVMALALKNRENDIVIVLGILLFDLMVGLLCFDITDHEVIHFVFLCGFILVSFLMTHSVQTTTASWLLPLCDVSLLAVVGTISLNVLVMKNKKPYLSIQAACEVFWAVCLVSWFANQLLLE
jgi:hypothetical protein